MVLQTALLCLSLNVYFEGRGESVAGQKAIAAVTYNRAEQKQANVCKEVYKPYQFSWTNKVKGTNNIQLKNKKALKQVDDKKAWKQAQKIALEVLREKHSFKKATHFHSKKVYPKWARAKKMQLVAVIGNHKFYRANNRG